MPPDASLRPTPDDSPIIGFFLMFTSNHVKKTLIQYIDLSSGYTTKYSIYKTDSWLLYFRYGQAVFDFHRKKKWMQPPPQNHCLQRSPPQALHDIFGTGTRSPFASILSTIFVLYENALFRSPIFPKAFMIKSFPLFHFYE